MNFFKTFISEYGMVIVYSILTAIAGAVAAFVKKKYKEKCDNKTKQEVVRNCVMMAQQVYRGLDGETKKQRAIEAISAMLEEKGISITALEINVLIEACVGEFKNVFNEPEVISEDSTCDGIDELYDDTIAATSGAYI